MNKWIQAVISGVVFLFVWLLLAALFGTAISDTIWPGLLTALAFGVGIYFFADRRGKSASTDSKKKI